MPKQIHLYNSKEECMCCEHGETRKGTSRLRYWEVDHFFKCPVVGMCLTEKEQKEILKKVGPKIKKRTPFELHELLVCSAETENKISRRIDTLLNRKLGKAADALLQLEPEQFVKRCMESFKAGEYLPGLWATAISPDLPLEAKKAVFGEIHMTMHWSGEESIRFKRKLSIQTRELEKANQSSQQALSAKRELQKTNKAIKRENKAMKTALKALQQEKENLKRAVSDLQSTPRGAELEGEVQYLEMALESQRDINTKQERQLAILGEERQRLSLQLEEQRAVAIHFQQEAREAIEDYFAVKRCDESCPSFNLCEKRVLIVGGSTRMESLYRELIEGSGGVFEYHDGYMRKGTRGLEGRLKRADVVLCPVNCNSHAACNAVKNLAKKHNKKVHMLANFSLNTGSRVLADSDATRGTINPGISQN